MERFLALLFVFALVSGTVLAEEPKGSPALTGDLRIDFFGLHELHSGPVLDQDPAIQGTPSKKSPWLAAGLSLLIPGAGEFYAESYWKAALFFALDVTAWYLAYSNNKKGNDQTEFFEGYANTHWNVVRYGQYAETLAPKGKTYAWRIPGTEGLEPWNQVNWPELNRMERDIGGYYSHTLPEYDSQQYYELIGKYPQFNQGWDDAPPTFNYGDPLTPSFLYYSAERGKANDFYATATTWVTVALVNHLLSAIDAAWTAGTYNSNLHARVGIRQIPLLGAVAEVPEVTVALEF